MLWLQDFEVFHEIIYDLNKAIVRDKNLTNSSNEIEAFDNNRLLLVLPQYHSSKNKTLVKEFFVAEIKLSTLALKLHRDLESDI